MLILLLDCCWACTLPRSKAFVDLVFALVERLQSRHCDRSTVDHWESHCHPEPWKISRRAREDN